MITKFSEIMFTPKNGTEISLVTTAGVFSPNTTTELLINAVKKTILSPVKTLDLGCGTGVVGLALWLEGLSKEPICSSDLSESAVLCSQENFKRYECKADVRHGALKARDQRDSEREMSPLKPAKDAFVIDTTSLSLEQVVEKVAKLAVQALT